MEEKELLNRLSRRIIEEAAEKIKLYQHTQDILSDILQLLNKQSNT